MTTFSDRIDHFVRWFVNSSPEVIHVEPRPKPAKGSAVGDEKGPRSGRDALNEAARRVPTRHGVEKFDRLDSPRRHSANASDPMLRRCGARAHA